MYVFQCERVTDSSYIPIKDSFNPLSNSIIMTPNFSIMMCHCPVEQSYFEISTEWKKNLIMAKSLIIKESMEPI